MNGIQNKGVRKGVDAVNTIKPTSRVGGVVADDINVSNR
jgi:hypothetical protein